MRCASRHDLASLATHRVIADPPVPAGECDPCQVSRVAGRWCHCRARGDPVFPTGRTCSGHSTRAVRLAASQRRRPALAFLVSCGPALPGLTRGLGRQGAQLRDLRRRQRAAGGAEPFGPAPPIGFISGRGAPRAAMHRGAWVTPSARRRPRASMRLASHPARFRAQGPPGGRTGAPLLRPVISCSTCCPPDPLIGYLK